MLDMISFDAALKTLYSRERVENMSYANNPLFALIPKNTSFGGANKVIDVIYGNSQGRSATFSNALSNQSDVQVTKFTITRAKDHAVASIDNETLLASQGDAYALLEASKTQIDSALDSLIRSVSIAMYRSGSGSIGQANAASTSTSLQLKSPDDVTNFEVNQVLVFSTADGGGSIKSGSTVVRKVNRDSGELTVDVLTAIAGGAGVAANDYIFVQGDYDKKIKGLSAWVPNSDPSATPFFGVDRSVDPTRLAGIRFDGSALPIEEALTSAISRVTREGGKPSHCLMNFENWNSLILALGSKVVYQDAIVKSGDATFSFRSVMIHGPRGPIQVIADQNCPPDRAFLVQMDTWKLESLGDVPRMTDTDGLRMLRTQNEDGVQIRAAYYAQLSCKAPGFNANVRLK
jgi:hypothetical protein